LVVGNDDVIYGGGDLVQLRGGDKVLEGRFSVDLCERGMPVWEIHWGFSILQ